MILAFSNFELDLQRQELRQRGRVVELQPLLLELLAYLARNRDRVVPKEELLQEVWKGIIVGDGAISQAVFLLRRTLTDHGAPPFIGLGTAHQPGPVM